MTELCIDGESEKDYCFYCRGLIRDNEKSSDNQIHKHCDAKVKQYLESQRIQGLNKPSMRFIVNSKTNPSLWKIITEYQNEDYFTEHLNIEKYDLIEDKAFELATQGECLGLFYFRLFDSPQDTSFSVAIKQFASDRINAKNYHFAYDFKTIKPLSIDFNTIKQLSVENDKNLLKYFIMDFPTKKKLTISNLSELRRSEDFDMEELIFKFINTSFNQITSSNRINIKD